MNIDGKPLRFSPDLRRARQLLPAGVPEGCRLVGALHVDQRPGALFVTATRRIGWMDGNLLCELDADLVLAAVGRHTLGL